MKNSEEKQWSGKSRGGYWGHHIFVAIIRTFGVRSAYVFLAFVAIYFIPFAPGATRAIWKYNRRILKYGVLKSVLKIYIHYYTFGQTIIDKVAINSGLGDRYKFEYDNYEEFLRVLDGGETIIIGAHVGCWEVGSQSFGDYANRLNIVMYDAEYQKIKETVGGVGFKHKIIPINEGSLESLIRIKQTLSKGEYVCMQGDRYLSKKSSVRVHLLGEDALLAMGPTLMASKFKTPVVFYFAMRERGLKYRFVFRVVESGLSQSELMDIYVEELAKVVKRYPQQWFNFFDVWNIE